MRRTIEECRRDLHRLVGRAQEFDFGLPTIDPDGNAREAAVLVLFGSLDRVNADAGMSTVPAELDVLLLRRSDDLSHHPGQVAFPGGGRDPEDSDAAAAALREAQEETNLLPSDVRVLGNLSNALIPHSGNLVTPVVAWWDTYQPLLADGEETVDVFRVPVAEMLDPQARYTAVLKTDDDLHVGPMFLLGTQFGSYPVWGFTAMILDKLYSELGWTIPWNEKRTWPVSRTASA